MDYYILDKTSFYLLAICMFIALVFSVYNIIVSWKEKKNEGGKE